MRTFGVIGALAALAFALLRWTWTPDEPDFMANFVYHGHEDGSLEWAIEIPTSTWARMQREVDTHQRRTMAEEVLSLVISGFEQRKVSAERCRITNAKQQTDGARRYWGHCAWSNALPSGPGI
jgi:hypothetical protein